MKTPRSPDGPSQTPAPARRKALKSAIALPATLLAGAAVSPDAALAAAPFSDPSDWHAYLTDEERQHPLAKYWYRTAPIADDVLLALRKGPVDAARTLAWAERTRLSDAGDLPTENGWCMLPDGSGFVAVRTRFPGCTAAMIDWWFEWAQREEVIRYKIWYPGAHYSMSQAPTPDAVRKPGDKAYWGMSRYPVEDVGMGVDRLRLDFHDPRDFGFAREPAGGTILCARVGFAAGWFKHSEFIHHVRAVPGGVEMRSRFWMARHAAAARRDDQFDRMTASAHVNLALHVYLSQAVGHGAAVPALQPGKLRVAKFVPAHTQR